MINRSRLLLLVSAVLCPWLHGTNEAPRPNIIFILADDLGYGDVGFNGQEKIRTPALDRMAAEGMVFTQHYAGATVCMPSRCTLLTGKHNGRATVRGNPRWTDTGVAVDLLPDDVTVAEELKRAGYTTAIIGKWGLAEASDDGMPLRQGFDYFYGYRNHRDAHHYYWPDLWEQDEMFHLEGNDYMNTSGEYIHDLLAARALDFITENRDGPFFLYLALTIPHYELTVPEDSKEPYRDLGWPENPMKKAHYRHDEEGNVAYAGMVSRMDRDIGRILDRLATLGIAENTLVIFTSDNGPEYERKDRFFNSNGPFRGGKRDLYEGGIRVPFVAWWPRKVEAGTRTNHISAFDDFLPTACELAGVNPSDDVTGLSYAPTLRGEANQAPRDYLYWEFNEKAGPMQAVRMGPWKGVKLKGKELEVYNLNHDPGETLDRAGDFPAIASKLSRLLLDARTPHPAFQLKQLDPWAEAKQLDKKGG
ncbi:MAG: arylsulfatase [Puniceicoccaceae bacterium]